MNLQDSLRTANKNITPERERLFVKMQDFHLFCARDIEESFSDIGRASIFRTIKLFCEIGILRRVHLGIGVEQYQINSHDNHHEHMKCESCGNIICFDSNLICNLLSQAAKKHGFTMKEHSINLFGTCQKCS